LFFLGNKHPKLLRHGCGSRERERGPETLSNPTSVGLATMLKLRKTPDTTWRPCPEQTKRGFAGQLKF
jgi:hypothetical protein